MKSYAEMTQEEKDEQLSRVKDILCPIARELYLGFVLIIGDIDGNTTEMITNVAKGGESFVIQMLDDFSEQMKEQLAAETN